MILVTGGLGFVGLHVAQNLLDEGESCVLTHYSTVREPEFVRAELGQRVFLEQLDVIDYRAIREIGERHEITGVVHLAVPGNRGAIAPFDEVRVNMIGLANVLEAAHDWQVQRVGMASVLGVYDANGDLPFREESSGAASLESPAAAIKRASEILASHLRTRAGFDIVSLRISGTFGPLYHTMNNLPSRLVHAAVEGRKPDLNMPRPPYAKEGGDMFYVRDCGRAIAMLQLADHLPHRAYNVASGHPTTNGEFVAAVKKVIPEADIELPEGHDPNWNGRVAYADIGRLRDDVGFEPAFTTDAAIADYIAWVRAGNPE